MLRRLYLAFLIADLFVLLISTLLYQHGPYQWFDYRYNLQPFWSIANDIRRGDDGFWRNFVGNLAIFGPLGAAFPFLIGPRARLWHAVVATAALSTTIELLQYQSGSRFADVDDVILNTTGAVLGFLAARLMIWPWASPAKGTDRGRTSIEPSRPYLSGPGR